MRSRVVTFITLSMTIEEARRAVTNGTDAQLAIRAALYQVDPQSVAQIIEQERPAMLAGPKRVRRNGHTPRRDKKVRTHRGKASADHMRECPHCHAMKGPQGFDKHVAACGRAAGLVRQEESYASG